MSRTPGSVVGRPNDQTTKPRGPGRWLARAAQLAPAPPIKPELARPAFRPGPPFFEQIGPNTWIETAWARERCIHCTRLLAPGDDLYCPDHRHARKGAMP